MDVILGCFFEYFESAERNSLHARHKRKAMVEYFNTLIEGCRLGQNADVQDTVRQAVVGIMRYHNTNRKENFGICMMGKYHNVLYVALKICYDWQLKDTPTVIALLSDIYGCERSFERLFIGAVFGYAAPYYIAGWKSDFSNHEENFRAMVFFLDHATKGCWQCNGVRFVDTVIEGCSRMSVLKIVTRLGAPDKVLILLRFGALVDPGQPWCLQESAIQLALNELNRHEDHSYPYNLVSCLQLLLRVVPSVRLPSECEPPDRLQRDIIMSEFPNLVQDCILPADRCGFAPPELKHLARCAIRQRLWQNFQLPNGIRSLPVPETMHRYIDIMED